MSVVGVDIPADRLVLQKGRDFKWSFRNVNDAGAYTAYPAGQLFFEFDTGEEHNAVQQVLMTGASGGTYRLGINGVYSSPIDYYDITNAPQDMPGDISSAIESISGYAGNVAVKNVSLLPEWVIKLTLNAGVNEVQHIRFSDSVTMGHYKLTYGLQRTGEIAFGADAATVQAALQGLSGIGSGNCTVTDDGEGGYYVEFVGSKSNTDVDQIGGIPRGLGFGLRSGALGLLHIGNVLTETVTRGTAKFGEAMVNRLNEAINNYFDQFENLLGVDINFVVTDQKNVTFTVTGRREFRENQVLTFAIDATSNAFESMFNGIANFLGVFQTIHVDFYWNHKYEVEFINGKGHLEIPQMTVNKTSLTGVNSAQDVIVTVVEPGHNRYVKWPFTISGDTASIKVESEAVDLIQQGTRWQLAFLPTGESAGGTLVGRGTTVIQQ